MTFADKSRYGRTLKKRKGGEYAMNYIKRFQNAQALSVSVGNTFSEDQLIHIFLDKFHQDGKYSAQISSHQAELRREGKLLIKNLYLFHPYIRTISSLHTDDLNLDSRLACGRSSQRANTVHTNCTFF